VLTITDRSDSSEPPARSKSGLLHLDRRAGRIADALEQASGSLTLTSRQAARELGVSNGWLEAARSHGTGPPFVRLAPSVIRYSREAIVRWLRDRELLSTARYPGGAPGRRGGRGRPRGAKIVNGKVVPPPAPIPAPPEPVRPRIVRPGTNSNV
jgi:hypothetical protein